MGCCCCDHLCIGSDCPNRDTEYESPECKICGDKPYYTVDGHYMCCVCAATHLGKIAEERGTSREDRIFNELEELAKLYNIEFYEMENENEY